MKKIKKLLAVLVTVAMAIGMLSMSAFAQDVDSGAKGTGSITISNAAKGETYTVYKLFDATVSKSGDVAYKGTVPEGLTDYFEETSSGSGYVQAKKAAFNSIQYYTDATKTTESATETAYWTGTGMSDGLKNALVTWKDTTTATTSAVSDGTTLKFTNLELGYYVVTTSQGENVISVDTTNPNVTMVDKSSKTPTADKKVNGKETESYSIGDTISFTGTFTTANYIGAGNDAVQVNSYTISDTLPEFLNDVKITGVKIIQDATDKSTYPDVDLSTTYTEFTNKKITIPWVDENDNTKSLYKNGSTIEITYTAKLTSTVNINGDNTNTITLTPNKDRNGENPFEDTYTDNAKVTTYAAALKKTDGSNALAGAKFKFNGLTVSKISDGVYQVVSYDSSSTTPGTEMEVDSNGKLYILGLASNVTLTGKETVAPDGYNLLTDGVRLTPQVLNEKVIHSDGKRYYDTKGNLLSSEETGSQTVEEKRNLSDLDENAVEVVNKKGSELPSTGGMGTTIFYVLGAAFVIGAGIVLVTRRKLSK